MENDIEDQFADTPWTTKALHAQSTSNLNAR